MEKELYSKSWYINTAKIAEAFILLDYMTTISTKSYNATHRSISVFLIIEKYRKYKKEE